MSAFIFVTGNVSTEPMVKKVGGIDAPAVVFQLGTTTGKKKEDGTFEQLYFGCVLYGKAGETFMKMAQKGTNITVHGPFSTQTYKKKDGSWGTSLSIQIEGKIEYNARMKGWENRSDDTDREAYEALSEKKAREKANTPKKTTFYTEDETESPW